MIFNVSPRSIRERHFMKSAANSPYPVYPRAAVGEEAIRALAASYNHFGQTIFASLIKKPGNVVYSPYSAGVAFAMAMSGARGATQAEFLDAIRLQGQPTEIAAANGRLAARLASYSDDGFGPPAGATSELCELLISNRLELVSPDGRLSIAPEYRDVLCRRYQAEIMESAKQNSRKPPCFRIFNSVDFDGRWETPFRESATEPLPFATTAGRRADVPMMQATRALPYFEGDGFKAVWLSYRPEVLGMAIVLPDLGVASNSVVARLGEDGLVTLARYLIGAGRQAVELRLPRFSIDSEMSLNAPAQAAGLRLAFEPGIADFGGITGRQKEDELYIDCVLKRATIEVAEEGTKARAETMMAIRVFMGSRRGHAPPPPIPFHVDRPFLFYIFDRDSGAILFQGRIDDPQAGRQSTVSPIGAGLRRGVRGDDS